MSRQSEISGSWKLLTWRLKAGDQTTYPFGKNPAGLLIYSPEGRMAVQMQASSCPTFTSNGPLGGDEDQRSAAYSTCLACFGTFEIRERRHCSSHRGEPFSELDGHGAGTGRVAIVTGATSGMGRGIAELFAREGASIVMGGRDEHRGQEVVTHIKETGGSAIFLAGDISTMEGNQELVNNGIERFGKLHILVANAGILCTGSVTTVPIELWHQTIGTNLHSVFYLLRAGLPHLQNAGGGAVVVNGSVVGYKGDPHHPAFVRLKARLSTSSGKLRSTMALLCGSL